jgi:hypothetical protein
MNKTMPKLNKKRRDTPCRYALQCVSTTSVKNAIRGNVNNFGDFYQRLVNTPTAQNQLAAFDTLFEFYYSLSFNCSSGSNAPNTRIEGGVR